MGSDFGDCDCAVLRRGNWVLRFHADALRLEDLHPAEGDGAEGGVHCLATSAGRLFYSAVRGRSATPARYAAAIHNHYSSTTRCDRIGCVCGRHLGVNLDDDPSIHHGKVALNANHSPLSLRPTADIASLRSFPP